MINEQMIRLIMKQIEDTPQHWDQGEWARSSELKGTLPTCKTTFCFAGWAAFMTDMVDGWGVPTAAGRRYKASVGFYTWDDDENDFPYQGYAAKLLGLNYEQASRIFDSDADQIDGGIVLDAEDLTVGQRIRRMKETIFQATGVDIP